MLVPACSEDASSIIAERLPRGVERDRIALLDPPNLGMAVHKPESPPDQCELGQTKPCFPEGTAGPSTDPAMNLRYKARCVRGWDGALRFSRAQCNTPLVVSFDVDQPVTFTRQTKESTSTFQIGASKNTEWVSSATPWLAVDIDGSGCIENQRELFGPPEDGSGLNGFDKLRTLDDNHDGHIDAQDASFDSLVLWFDRDQDKRCTPSEITKVRDAGIDSLDLAYATSPVPSRVSSYEGEHAALWFKLRGQALQRGRLIDVYLEPMD
jgi:hypothetical protein